MFIRPRLVYGRPTYGPPAPPFGPIPDETEDSLDPIARFDVVPHQRIDHGETMNCGVVAFSKEGINRVIFSVDTESEANYTGPEEITVSAMTLNTQLAWDANTAFGITLDHSSWPGVWEYWTPIRASDFSSDGNFTLNALVIGNDGGRRSLSVDLRVNATGALAQHEAWIVLSGGNDSTGTVGNSSLPFATVTEAMNAFRAVNGGNVDGCILRFGAGDWNIFESYTANTVNEWVTFARAAGTEIGDVRITGHRNWSSGGPSVGWLRLYGIEFTNVEPYQWLFHNTVDEVWLDHSQVVGNERWTEAVTPLRGSSIYATESRYYFVDAAFEYSKFVRNCVAHRLGDDVLKDVPFSVNVRADDMDNGSDDQDEYGMGNSGYFAHSDLYQSVSSISMNNQIAMNIYGTNLHYQGVFLRGISVIQSNNAFVNIFLEMRWPPRQGNANGSYRNVPFALSGEYHHFLLWHCTFAADTSGYFTSDGTACGLEDTSFIGCVFNPRRHGSYTPDFSYENSDGNVALHNAFRPIAAPDNVVWDSSEHNDAHILYTVGVNSILELDLDSSPAYGGPIPEPSDSSIFGSPREESDLIERYSNPVVPFDVWCNPRDEMADVGAIQIDTGG